jgi:hypothetical protein
MILRLFLYLSLVVSVFSLFTPSFTLADHGGGHGFLRCDCDHVGDPRCEEVIETCDCKKIKKALEKPEEGKWVKSGDFVVFPLPPTVNVGCRQTWACQWNSKSEKVMYAQGLTTLSTEDQTTTGGCSSAGGPLDNCNACIAGPPDVACKVVLVLNSLLDKCPDEVKEFRKP